MRRKQWPIAIAFGAIALILGLLCAASKFAFIDARMPGHADMLMGFRVAQQAAPQGADPLAVPGSGAGSGQKPAPPPQPASKQCVPELKKDKNCPTTFREVTVCYVGGQIVSSTQGACS